MGSSRVIRVLAMMTVLLTVLLMSAAANASPEIWLASTADCNTCGIYREIAEQRHYGDALMYEGSAGAIKLPIREIRKDALLEVIRAQLPEDVAPYGDYWDVQLLVLVVDDDKVLAAGNIADSGNWQKMKYSKEVMFPPRRPRDDDPVFMEEDAYSSYFLANWNLEYFVAVALGDAEPFPAPDPLDLAAAAPFDVGPAAVVLWGSASTPLENALFIATRMKQIRTDIQSLNIPLLKFVGLYGHGPRVPGNDTSYIERGKIRFKRMDVGADLDASANSLSRVMTSVANTAGNHTLLVQIGHSGEVGSPMWGDLMTLTPEDLVKVGGAKVDEADGGEILMVSGGCMSGLFARSVSCGFFAAHPEVLAAGCQLSPEVIEKSDDYLRHFFAAASDPAKVGRKHGDDVPLTEAHWYASERLEDHQIAYTTTDALVDGYFEEHPGDLPSQMTVGELRRSSGWTSIEAATFARMAHSLKDDVLIDLTNYVDLNHVADEKLADATEMSASARNAISAMPYRLMLPVLARRAVYRQKQPDEPALGVIARCESQTLRSFLGAPFSAHLSPRTFRKVESIINS